MWLEKILKVYNADSFKEFNFIILLELENSTFSACKVYKNTSVISF